MAGRDRERRLAREHHERQQAARSERDQQQRRRNALTGAVVAAALVLGGVVWVGLATGGDDDGTVTAEPGGEPAPAGSAEPTPGQTAGEPGTAAAACPEAAPTSEATLEYDEAPAAEDVLTEGVDYVATLATNCGDVVIDLAEGDAPQTVASFAFLAQEGYFDSTPCHRVVTEGIFVLQCGDPTGQGSGGPGYQFPNENLPTAAATEGAPAYPAGTVAMANAGPDTNGSQFFIVYEDTALPPDYSVFGTVTEGLDVVREIAAAGVAGGATDGAPAQPVVVESVDIQEQGA